MPDSRLVGIPVLVGGISDRGVVAACSYEARQFGIHSAMPMRMAKQLCPEAIMVRGQFRDVHQALAYQIEIIQEQVPLFEKTSIDEFYIDLTGMDRFWLSKNSLRAPSKSDERDRATHFLWPFRKQNRV